MNSYEEMHPYLGRTQSPPRKENWRAPEAELHLQVERKGLFFFQVHLFLFSLTIPILHMNSTCIFKPDFKSTNAEAEKNPDFLGRLGRYRGSESDLGRIKPKR